MVYHNGSASSRGPVHYGEFGRQGLAITIRRDTHDFVRVVEAMMHLLQRLEALGPRREDIEEVRARTNLAVYQRRGGRHSWVQDVYAFAAQAFRKHNMWPLKYTRLPTSPGYNTDTDHTMVAEEVICHGIGGLIRYGLLEPEDYWLGARYVRSKVRSK
jgi:hypothetical protein